MLPVLVTGPDEDDGDGGLLGVYRGNCADEYGRVGMRNPKSMDEEDWWRPFTIRHLPAWAPRKRDFDSSTGGRVLVLAKDIISCRIPTQMNGFACIFLRLLLSGLRLKNGLGPTQVNCRRRQVVTLL